jgi:hypothetical protein
MSTEAILTLGLVSVILGTASRAQGAIDTEVSEPGKA